MRRYAISDEQSARIEHLLPGKPSDPGRTARDNRLFSDSVLWIAARDALGRSRGGLTTKVHAACDALGNPLRFLLTPGQRNDAGQAEGLLDGYEPEAVIADKGYDADRLVAQIKAAGAEPVIPPKANRVEPRDYDANLYADRNKIERLFNRLGARPAGGNAVREAGAELPRVRSRGSGDDAAALNVTTPWRIGIRSPDLPIPSFAHDPTLGG